jgi:hypothetical protein
MERDPSSIRCKVFTLRALCCPRLFRLERFTGDLCACCAQGLHLRPAASAMTTTNKPELKSVAMPVRIMPNASEQYQNMALMAMEAITSSFTQRSDSKRKPRPRQICTMAITRLTAVR